MKRWIILIGYWLVHISGIFPVVLKTTTKKLPVFLLDQRISWTPWTSSKRSVLIGLSQMFIVLWAGYEWYLRMDGVLGYSWSHRSIELLVIQTIAMAGVISVFCTVLITTMRRQEIKKLLNSVCSLYINVFKSPDPPKARKFAYLIVYFILSACELSSSIFWQSSHLRNIWEIFNLYTVLFTEIISATICIYLQTAVEELNRKIKNKFPSVDEWDWKYWGPTPCTEENNRQEGPRLDVKSVLQEYRLTYRTVANIVDRMNSVYGCLQLIYVVLNQLICLMLAFCFISLLLKSQTENFDKLSWRMMISCGCYCVWCFVEVSVNCYSFEIVIKELEVTTNYIATIDASEIDLGSKLELLEFLEEIDGRKIRFMASNIFSLDYATLYVLLTNTATYIIIVIQYLS